MKYFQLTQIDAKFLCIQLGWLITFSSPLQNDFWLLVPSISRSMFQFYRNFLLETNSKCLQIPKSSLSKCTQFNEDSPWSLFADLTCLQDNAFDLLKFQNLSVNFDLKSCSPLFNTEFSAWHWYTRCRVFHNSPKND